MESFLWLQQWYLNQCDGEWEFDGGIKILSVSNPGWSVEISLINTRLATLDVPFKLFRNSSDDWYGYLIEDEKFIASGDPTKLSFIIDLFKALMEN